MNPLTDREIDPIAESEAALVQGQAPAVVVVHYRPQRWWSSLLPPAVLLLLACGILSYRIWVPDWVGLAASPAGPFSQTAIKAPVQPAEVVTDADVAPPAQEPEPQPVSVAVTHVVEEPTSLDPDPAPATIDVTPEAEVAAVVTEEEPSRLVVSIKPPSERKPEADPQPTLGGSDAATEPSADVANLRLGAEPKAVQTPPVGETLADIARAANAIQEDRQELEELKADLLDESRKEDIAEEMEARKLFLSELRELVQQASLTNEENIAGQIHALTDKSGKTKAGLTAGMIAFGQRRTGRVDRIRWLRTAKVAESEILRQLEHDNLRNRVSRNGPKTDSEATLRAARQLLEVALTPQFVPPPDLQPVKPAAASGRVQPRPLKFPVSSRR